MERVLVTSRSFGKTSEKPFDILRDARLEYVLMGADYSDEAFAEAVPDFDALIIGAHDFAPETMARCNKLKIVCKHGAGLDNIDLETAKKLGITVTNVPAMNANAVADLAFAHILGISRGVTLANNWVHEGRWKTFIGRDVFQKTLGLMGFGAIAKNVARRAAGFSMKVLACDPYIKGMPAEFSDYVTLCGFETMISKSDIVSIHVPLTDGTRDLFDKGTLMKMKKEAVLVNTGRGGIINERDLYECMSAGHLLGAALDVTQAEPIEKDNLLLELENVVITPHIGMYSLEAINAVSVTCAENVAKKLRGETPSFVVV
jgi:D-3-phosphoglycerate dehydrogenase